MRQPFLELITTSFLCLVSKQQSRTTQFRNESPARKMANVDDEFGDASFLDDFDVDAAVAAATSPPVPPPAPPAKRAKVSPEHPISTAAPRDSNRNKYESSSKFSSLENCLQQYFGYSEFRPGQKHVIECILQGQDVAVFWATGSGKSMCYQLPALYFDGQVALVVSPLISLMQDQVHKLNTLSERNIATFLGSAQHDSRAESKALAGEYPLVYVTPEKLMASGFIDQLSRLNLCLIAIDESHCVR